MSAWEAGLRDTSKTESPSERNVRHTPIIPADRGSLQSIWAGDVSQSTLCVLSDLAKA